MSRKSFFWRALGALVVLGLLAGSLIVGGAAIHRISWSQGYAAGQMAEGGEESNVIPKMPPYMHYRGHGYPSRGFGLGSLFAIGMFFLLLVMIGKVFRWMIFGKAMMHGGRWAKGTRHPHHWGKRRRWRHGHPRHCGPVPPWCWDCEQAPEEQADEEQSEADVETGATEQ